MGERNPLAFSEAKVSHKSRLVRGDSIFASEPFAPIAPIVRGDSMFAGEQIPAIQPIVALETRAYS